MKAKTKPKGARMKRPANELSLLDTARILKCSYYTARNMCLDGRLRGGIRGRTRHERWYVEPASVTAFLKP